MTVLKLVPYSNKDTVSVLKVMLAKAMAGEIVGLAACYKTSNGIEDSTFAGHYKAKPAEAANAAMVLCIKIAQIQQEHQAQGRPLSG